MSLSKSVLITCAVILFSLCSLNLFARESPSNKFSLESELSINDQGEYIVAIKLKNISGQNMEIYISDLPWAYSYNFIESITISDSKATIYTELISYSHEPVHLINQEVLTGEVNVSGSVLDAAVLIDEEFTVFWRYKLRLANGVVIGELSGELKKPNK